MADVDAASYFKAVQSAVGVSTGAADGKKREKN